jgi:hypothetical protein
MYTFSSMLRLAEDAFHLPSLGTSDRRAHSLQGSLDLHAAPLPPLILKPHACPTLPHRPSLGSYAAAAGSSLMLIGVLVALLSGYAARRSPLLADGLLSVWPALPIAVGVIAAVASAATGVWIVHTWHLPPPR